MGTIKISNGEFPNYIIETKYTFSKFSSVAIMCNTGGAANLIESDRGRILAFVECMECNYYMFFIPQKMGII